MLPDQWPQFLAVSKASDRAPEGKTAGFLVLVTPILRRDCLVAYFHLSHGPVVQIGVFGATQPGFPLPEPTADVDRKTTSL